MKLILLAALVATLPSSGARADWLGDAWPPDRMPAHGNPAITFNKRLTVEYGLAPQGCRVRIVELRA